MKEQKRNTIQHNLKRRSCLFIRKIFLIYIHFYKGACKVESATKNRQSFETLGKMVQKAFNNQSIKQIKELKEGFFNVAYLIELSNKTEVILKIAPPKDSVIMTHEKNIMYSEVKSMQYVSKEIDIPIAEVLYYDASHTLCDSDYFFMSKLPGQSFHVLMDELTESGKNNIYFQLGKYNAMLNGITGEKFGYFGQEERQMSNWFLVFKSMIEDTIKDAETLNIDLQIDTELLLELLERDKNIFEEVVTPKFVHWDLWAGNIFINNQSISGIIDFERCLWADELMEAGFRSNDYNEDFMKGYGIQQLSDSQKKRVKWYDIYLFLIQALESDYRHYETRDFYNWSTENLKQWINALQ